MIKKYRQEQKKTIKKLSEETDISQRTLESYDNGRRDINKANIKHVFSIAVALKKPAYKIVTDPQLVKLMKKERRIK